MGRALQPSIEESRHLYREAQSTIVKAEKRARRRRTTRVGARLFLLSGEVFEARIMDLSASGMSLLVHERLQAHQYCVVTFALSLAGRSHPLDLVARVLYRELHDGGFRAALEFIEVAPEVTEFIRRFIARNEPRTSKVRIRTAVVCA
jgi:c-di-GMP-binding flagellar brake protein YcgR